MSCHNHFLKVGRDGNFQPEVQFDLTEPTGNESASQLEAPGKTPVIESLETGTMRNKSTVGH